MYFVPYYIYIYIYIYDGASFIDTGLELAGVIGLVRRAGSIYNLHRKGGPTGECQPSLRCLSQFLSLQKKKGSSVDGFVIAYLSSVELLDIYHG